MTLVGVLAVAAAGRQTVFRARAQACADAVALAMVAQSRGTVDPLLRALEARVTGVSRDGDTVTVSLETPWGTATATATIGS